MPRGNSEARGGRSRIRFGLISGFQRTTWAGEVSERLPPFQHSFPFPGVFDAKTLAIGPDEVAGDPAALGVWKRYGMVLDLAGNAPPPTRGAAR